MSKLPDSSLRFTAPAATLLAWLANTVGLALLAAFVVDSMRDRTSIAGIVIFGALYAVTNALAFVAGIETTVTDDRVLCLRCLGPIRRETRIVMSEIVEIVTPSYTSKIVARMRDGTSHVIANRYSVPRSAIPDLPRNPGDPTGSVHRLRCIREVLQSRVRVKQGSHP